MRILAAALSLFAFTGAAVAQSCAARETIITDLRNDYSEELAFGGIRSVRGVLAVMEVWVSRETWTYTVLLSHANGISCVLFVGTGFFEALQEIEPDGDPT